jgi:argininosuccinate synthase
MSGTRDHVSSKADGDTVVLAYSGGPRSSEALARLRQLDRRPIVTITVDLGQGADFEDLRDRALALGAVRTHVVDARDEFARGFILPSLQADAADGSHFPFAAALGRALVAGKLVEIAGFERTRAVAHGATAPAAGQCLRTLIATLAARGDTGHGLGPALQILAPVEESGQFRVTLADANLWGRSLDLAGVAEPPAFYRLTKSLPECPSEPAQVELCFESGRPVAINGVTMAPVDLIASLGTIAGRHGVGRRDTAGDCLGSTGRLSEAPAAVVLHAAHAELQRVVTADDLAAFARQVSARYTRLIQSGLWFSPFREALDGFVERVQQRVTGVVCMKLLKGACRIEACTSPFARSGATVPSSLPLEAGSLLQ